MPWCGSYMLHTHEHTHTHTHARAHTHTHTRTHTLTHTHTCMHIAARRVAAGAEWDGYMKMLTCTHNTHTQHTQHTHTQHTQHTYLYQGADLEGYQTLNHQTLNHQTLNHQTLNPQPYTGAELEGYTIFAPVGRSYARHWPVAFSLRPHMVWVDDGSGLVLLPDHGVCTLSLTCMHAYG